MALSKSIASLYSTAAVYWRVSSVHLDIDNLTVTANVKGYPSQAASDAKAVPLSVTDISYVAANQAAMESITLSAIYTFLKTKAMFSGASDV